MGKSKCKIHIKLPKCPQDSNTLNKSKAKCSNFLK